MYFLQNMHRSLTTKGSTSTLDYTFECNPLEDLFVWHQLRQTTPLKTICYRGTLASVLLGSGSLPNTSSHGTRGYWKQWARQESCCCEFWNRRQCHSPEPSRRGQIQGGACAMESFGQKTSFSSSFCDNSCHIWNCCTENTTGHSM